MANEVGSAFGEEFTTIPNSSNTTTYMLATNTQMMEELKLAFFSTYLLLMHGHGFS
jgi:hypothetical protein